MEDKEVLLKLNPKFNIIYELGMPTGKKIKNSILAIIIVIIVFIIGNIGINYLNITDSFKKANMTNIMNITLYIILAVIIIKLVINLVMQILQYKNITYTFYSDQLEYKDTFWNQQTKIIRYENVKEIEVRKNIWERINKCGIIILYTNAEKKSNKGMIIYSIKNVDEVYEKIQSIVNNVNNKIINMQASEKTDTKNNENIDS